MSVRSFGYAGVGSRDISDWSSFGTEVLGLQCRDKTSSMLGFRMDDRKRRIFIDSEIPEGRCFFGWEVEDAAALDKMAARVEAAGVPVKLESKSVADARCVEALISFDDPVGNRMEIFFGPEIDTAPFVPGRSISGFRTGALGIGHAVVTVNNIQDVLPFYLDVLGFNVSDYMKTPFRAYFLHINPRHHSLAIIETGSIGIHHLMLEMYSLDDVGQGLDIVNDRDILGVSMGRHTNDFMTSFYTKTPSPFMIECGWGGLNVDMDTWTSQELTDGPSLWGHERYWLSDEAREAASQMRMEVASRGVREPVHVMEGNFLQMADLSPWLGKDPNQK